MTYQALFYCLVSRVKNSTMACCIGRHLKSMATSTLTCDTIIIIQECIPVGCVPSGLPNRDPPGQRPPWTETPRQRPPWTETPWTETSLDRDLPGHVTCGACWDRDPALWTEFLTHACENITLPQLR